MTASGEDAVAASKSRMRGNVHVRFGKRAGETDRSKARHRASARPHLALQVLDEVRRRRQQQIHGHRGRKDDPLFRLRRVLRVAQERLDPATREWVFGVLHDADSDDEVAAAGTRSTCSGGSTPHPTAAPPTDGW